MTAFWLASSLSCSKVFYSSLGLNTLHLCNEGHNRFSTVFEKHCYNLSGSTISYLHSPMISNWFSPGYCSLLFPCFLSGNRIQNWDLFGPVMLRICSNILLFCSIMSLWECSRIWEEKQVAVNVLGIANNSPTYLKAVDNNVNGLNLSPLLKYCYQVNNCLCLHGL